MSNLSYLIPIKDLTTINLTCFIAPKKETQGNVQRYFYSSNNSLHQQSS